MSLSLARLSRQPLDARSVGRASAGAVTLFTRQLSTLLVAGLPLIRSLETLLRQERDRRLRAIIADLCLRIRGGATFSEALRAHRRSFDQVFVSMVRAGEAAGDLVAVLARVADFREKRARTRGRLRGAMIYPCIVVTVALVIVGVLVLFVIPQFQEIFDGMLRGQRLPALTAGVVGLAEGVRGGWPWLLLTGAAMVASGMAASHLPGVRPAVGRLVFRTPGIGSVVRRSAVARYARTLGTLLRAGVPILEALEITRCAAGNGVIQRFVDLQVARIRDGDPVAAAMQDHPAFSPMVASMMAVGEETGRLPELCDRIADNCEEELDRMVSAFIAAVEPLMIVFLALFVGIIVIALFLPVVSIIHHLGAG